MVTFTNDDVELLVFGDVTASFEDDLGRLLHVRENEALVSFFERVAFGLREELGRQPPAVQVMFPRFTTLIDLVAAGESEGAPVLRFCLMTVCQLAKFIHFAERTPFPSPANTYLLGICTGSFSASAICVSRSVSEVVFAGAEAARVAFRTALCSFLRRSTITTAGKGPWSAVVLRDKPVERLVDDFDHNRLSRPYISATSPKSATISGPPDVVDDFVARNKLELQPHRLPVESPFHAGHLFSEHDVESVLERFPEAEFLGSEARIPILSDTTGEVMAAAGFKDLLRTASTNVLRRVVRWEDMLATCAATLGNLKHVRRCTIYPFYCNAAPLLSSYLAHETSIEVAVQSISPPKHAATRPTGRFDQSKIAIVGYSGRFPEAASNEEFWDLLRAGRDVHRTIPEDRFDWETYYDPTRKKKNTNRVKYGCFINKPGLFDARFFNMSPREADNTDPAQRLAITATYEAMEMAGMVPNRTPSTQQDRVGVFFGVTSDDWREVNSSQNVDTYFIPGGVRAFMPGRISYFFGFSGPSLCVDTACSSSSAAIQSACGYLWRGECDTAIAGGTNVLTNPDIFTGLDRGHFLSQSGNCNTFDDEASGYCRAEAVGAVILKRLEDALADRDPIVGVIAGASTNHCGQTDSITRPHEGDQASVFNRVLRYQNVDANAVSYVEMHGTGTQAGDATEMRSVLSVFLPDDRRSPQQPLYLGSAKANIGHGEAASGVAALIKVLLMMKHDEIPPHCGIKTRINRTYPKDLAQRNVRIALEPTPWRRDAGGTRRAFLNNFSAAGGNTAILLEDAPSTDDARTDDAPAQRDQRGTHLVAVTAKWAKSLAANVRSLESFLEANPSTSLPALSYTTTARRLHHGYRVACSGDSVDSILRELRARSAEVRPVPGPSKLPAVAFVFTGQGTLYTGLGRELFQHVSGFRDDMIRFNHMAQQQGFPQFLSLIDGSAQSPDDDTCASHLALVCLQMALSRLWNSWGVLPSLVVGHSLGEYAALFAAGVISACDGIFLVGTRARLLATSCTPGTHAMLAIKAAVDTVRPLLASSACELTCINQPMGTVVGGHRDDINRLATVVRAQGHESVLLDIPFSFHTAQVDPILQDFEAAARSVRYHKPRVPVLSPLLGCVMRDGFDGAYLARACRGVVNFQGALEAANALVDERTVWLEMGSHPACSGMIKGTLGAHATTLSTLRKSTCPWKCIVPALESMYLWGLQIDWNNYHRDFEESHRVIQLDRYNWDLKNHWIMYKNDFLLTKGEGSETPETKASFRYVSPSVQRVLQHSPSAATSTLLAESDIFDDRLVHVLRGHLVNGAALCPSSLYGDVALTVAKTMAQDNPDCTGFDVCDVKIDHPLIALPSETSHLFRVSATADWSSRLISLSIYSVDGGGNKTASHATAKVRLSEGVLDQWKPMAYLINGRIASLERGVADGNSHKLKRPLVYKLFASIVDYSPEYQGMQEVILDSEQLEATAKVSFRVDDQGFVMNPHWIDSLGHLAGFIMNGNESLPSDKQVFINHGWSRLRFAELPEKGKVYTTYNKMQLVEGKLYAGDTYVLDGQRIVALFERVAFQGVPRRVLDNLLPGKTITTPARHSPAPPQRSPSAIKNPPGDLDRVLAIIADEVGTDVAELHPDGQFADFGLDSLLSLTVTSRINSEIGINLPPTLFAAYPTVRDLESLLDPRKGAASETPQLTSGSTDEDDGGDLTSPSDSTDSSFCVVIRQTIADETGTPAADLVPTTVLADLGVDSLLSLTIADSLSGAFGAQVPSSLFLEKGTLEEVEATLGKVLGRDPSTSIPCQPDDVVSSPPHATSIVLQRATSPVPSRVLFLLPDGSGSAASYASLAQLDPGSTVYGLNCPWRTTPQDMTRAGVTTSQLVAKFVTEIRRHQPHGPYYLGGWSAGGIFAFEAARQLMAAGEAVDKLLLVDAPNPIGLENPPSRMFEFFESTGIFASSGSKTVPKWLRHHFDSVVRMLDGYDPRPLPNAPPTVVIYARDGICKDPSAAQLETNPDDPREMLWLLHNRTDFSADGWATLIGRDKIKVHVLDNVNHFTMMDQGPHMEQMRQCVQQEILEL